MKIVKYILIGLLALQLTFAGVMKVIMPLFGVNTFIENMAGLNYNYTWAVIIGLIDIAGGIGLLFPKYRGYAAIGLIFLLHGAVGSHVTHNEPIASTIGGAGLSIVLLTVVLILDKPFGLIDKARNTTYFND